jgi:hypothetical protein
MFYKKQNLSLALASLLISGNTWAAPIVSFGSGSAVNNVDLLATFDTLTSYNVADLSTYTENNLDVQTQVSWANHPLCGAGGCWYANGGVNEPNGGYWAVISESTGANIQALEFDISSGGGVSTFNTFSWESYLNGILTGSNSFTYTGNDTYGFTDIGGFDELRVAITGSDPQYQNWNVIGMDNLKVELGGNTSILEPGSLALFGLGLLGLGLYRRRG